MDLRISDGLSEASVRLEARFITGSSKDGWSLAYCNEGAARGEYPEEIFQNDRWDLTKWR
jgi:hypothetical protein